MKKNELKSFDITTYDVQIEYSKKLAPVEKKIDRIDQNHEKKSLKAHKDFLAKEKKSKAAIKALEDKLQGKKDRITKAKDNKIVKIDKKIESLLQEYNEYKEATTASIQKEIDRIQEETQNLKQQEEKDIKRIKDRYSQNVTSYVERLNTYNENFEANKKTFTDQYTEYGELLEQSLQRISQTKDEDEKTIHELLSSYIEQKETDNQTQLDQTNEHERQNNSQLIHIRRESNIKKNEIKALINELKASFEVRYKTAITKLDDEIKRLNTAFEVRKLLINKDLEINNEKLQKQIDELKDTKNKKMIKSINMKKDLFNIRAETVVEYEQTLLNQKIKIIEEEIAFYKKTLSTETTNIEKLTHYLQNDQDYIKHSAEFFKEINNKLAQELYHSELANNEYLVKHEKLKTEFLQNYISQFHQIKERLIHANQQQITQLKTINSELDDIDKFLDTVEPLKEIELNHLRESIEVGEIEERYQIKYAKQLHETKLLQNQLRKELALQDMATKELILEHEKQKQILNKKEHMDYIIADARLKHDKAEEIHKLRKNSTKLERSILKSSYESELEKAELQKDFVSLSTEKDNTLQIKEIELQIERLQKETDYKSEVINKQLEEDLMTLQEQIRTYERERDMYVTTLTQIVGEKEQDTDARIIALNKEMDQKLVQVEHALEREVKEPSLNIARGEVIIKERMSKLETNNIFFQEFIDSTTQLMQSENLSPDQIKQLITKNKSIFDKSYKYIDNTYQVLTDAVSFMNEIEATSIENKIEATDPNKVKRIEKQLQKRTLEIEKQYKQIESSKKDHKNKIKSSIQSEINQIAKQKKVTEDSLKEQINTLYESTFSLLKDLQKNISNEVLNLYSPLTKKDQERLDKARENAEKSKQRIEQEREEKILPITKELRDYMTEKEQEKQKIIEDYNDKIKIEKDKVQEIKNKALEDVNQVTKSQKEEKEQLSQKLAAIKNQKTPIIEKEINEISRIKLHLEEDYYSRLKILEHKDEETDRIFEYENRIYNIALENAESRYQDQVEKLEIKFQNDLQEIKDEITFINNQAQKNIEHIAKELQTSINEHEKNIFTVRPRFEESIGDAQKAIDDEKEIKLERRKELIEQNRKMTAQIEQIMFASFKEAYDKLQDNLDYYVEKYKIIEEEYFNTNKTSSSTIETLQKELKERLFNDLVEQHKKKTEDINKM